MCMPKVRSKAVFAALSISLMGLGHAADAAVVLLSEFRDTFASASVNTSIGSESASSSRNSSGDFSDFDDSVAVGVSLGAASASASAQQTSQISTTSISASGMATANAEITPFDPSFFTVASASANTGLSVSFELTTPQLFDLSGALSSDPSTFSFGQAGVSLNSQDGSFSLSLGTPFFGAQTTPFDLSGTLFPNIYTLTANANIGANAFSEEAVSGTTDFSFALHFSAVPIPAAFWLFGTGLIGLAGFAKTRKIA
jgi:hypothetical protein